MSALTGEQRLETRRAILQSIAEVQRGLKLASLQLKQGMFGGARESITGSEGLLLMHEALAISLLKENQRLTETLEKVEALAEDWRYKGEHGWGAWQEGHGPDHEGFVLDGAAGELRTALGTSA